jgi:carbohydrate-binding DOMON domain-containing protein
VVTVKADGSWNTTLPVSTFATGVEKHALAFYAPDVQVSTPRMRFTSDVPFTGVYVDVADPVGDDKGPSGTYTYPQDSTFAHQMDLTHAQFAVGPTTLVLTLTVRDFTTVWNPPLGFDHVAFNVFFSLPGRTGATALPFLNAPFPGAGQWSYDHFAYGWNSALYGSDGATANAYGTSVGSPKVKTDQSTKTIAFTYDRRALGLASWSGVKVYVTTWDFDGIKGVLRPLSPAGGQWEMGGGQASDPKIMDDLPVVTLP